jgi:hypothetical protein
MALGGLHAALISRRTERTLRRELKRLKRPRGVRIRRRPGQHEHNVHVN